jgi:hypothetical protein
VPQIEGEAEIGGSRRVERASITNEGEAVERLCGMRGG